MFQQLKGPFFFKVETSNFLNQLLNDITSIYLVLGPFQHEKQALALLAKHSECIPYKLASQA